MKNPLLITCPRCGYMIHGRLWRCPGCGGIGIDGGMPEKGKEPQPGLSSAILAILKCKR
jgi:hypothetical protein